MTSDQFRNFALALAGAVESQHMNHPDFRIGGKIFATLAYPDETSGMVNLTPEQQLEFIKKSPKVFNPCAGAWGLRGATHVHLSLAKASEIRSVLKLAHENVQQKLKRKKV